MSNEALDELCVDQVEAMSKIAQHLLTSNLSNSDYEAILLCHKDDMDQAKDKTVNEDERDGNVDAWLSSISEVSMKGALEFLREDYLTTLGSNAKDLSPMEVYEAVNEAYKG